MESFRLSTASEKSVKVKVPKWISSTNYSAASIPPSKLDELDGEGTVFDTVRKRPSQKYRTYKQVTRRLAEAEEWVEFINKKRSKI